MKLGNLKRMLNKERFLFIVAILCFIVFVSLQFNIWFGDNSYSKLSSLKHEITEKEKSNLGLARKNLELEEERNKLTSGKDAIEGLARSELGLIKPGEILYKFKSEENPTGEKSSDQSFKD